LINYNTKDGPVNTFFPELFQRPTVKKIIFLTVSLTRCQDLRIGKATKGLRESKEVVSVPEKWVKLRLV